jgi:hypothetical protein
MPCCLGMLKQPHMHSRALRLAANQPQGSVVAGPAYPGTHTPLQCSALIKPQRHALHQWHWCCHGLPHTHQPQQTATKWQKWGSRPSGSAEAHAGAASAARPTPTAQRSSSAPPSACQGITHAARAQHFSSSRTCVARQPHVQRSSCTGPTANNNMPPGSGQC